MSGKVAIITGCSSGIGLATTQLFLSQDYQVFGVDIGDFDTANVDEKHLERLHFHKIDLTKEGSCDEVVKACIAKFGEKIDVLANVAGVMDAFEAADTVSDSQWDRVIAVNLTAPTKMIRAVLPSMKAHKHGSIINVSSKAGISGASAGIAYTASKHGLLGVTRHTAWRFRAEGIRCNAVLPGAVGTNIQSSIDQSTWDQEAYAHLAPVHELAMPRGETTPMHGREIANAILFLASDTSSMVNGVSMPVDQAWGAI